MALNYESTARELIERAIGAKYRQICANTYASRKSNPADYNFAHELRNRAQFSLPPLTVEERQRLHGVEFSWDTTIGLSILVAVVPGKKPRGYGEHSPEAVGLVAFRIAETAN